MLFMGTNDEYWTVDAIKHYIDSIPGQNFVHYVPNVGHDLGDQKQAMAALSAFFGATVAKQAVCSLPTCADVWKERNHAEGKNFARYSGGCYSLVNQFN